MEIKEDVYKRQDVRNLAKADDIKLDMIAMLALDLIGVIPVIGALKYSDEIGTLFKSARCV